MAENSAIEWTDTTWQVSSGCTRVSPGCQGCYAEVMAGRLAAMAEADEKAGRDPGKKRVYLEVVNPPYGPKSGWNRKLVPLVGNLTEPLRWKKPRRIFVNSMSDLFHKDVPFEHIDRVFAVMALCPQHTFQVLTKRPDRMAEYFAARQHPEHGRDDFAPSDYVPLAMHAMSDEGAYYGAAAAMPWPLPNVWLGTSVEDQQRADERIPHLLRCPARVRFLSCEPLLGPVDLRLADRWCALTSDAHECQVKADHLHWVICGGESGPGARPMHPDWARSLRDQCQAAGVAFFFKQWGDWVPFGYPLPDLSDHASSFTLVPRDERWDGVTSNDGPVTRHLDGNDYAAAMARVGKKAAGRLLDGRTWDEFPEVA